MDFYLKNMMEESVINALNELSSNKVKYGFGGLCLCDRCRLDIIALALNKLPPHYVVSNRGEALARANNLNSQFDVDILQAILAATKLVVTRPRH